MGSAEPTERGAVEAAGSSAMNAEYRIQALLRGRTTDSLLQWSGRMHLADLDGFRPYPHVMREARSALQESGLTVDRVGRFGFSLRGSLRQVGQVMGVSPSRLLAAARPSEARQAFFPANSPWSRLLLGWEVLPAPETMAALRAPPALPYPTLDGDALRKHLSVPSGLAGAGVRVAVIDSGLDCTHPWFVAQGWVLKTGTYGGSDRPDLDLDGHGTAMAWCIKTVAPQCELIAYRLTNPVDAIETAADEGAHVISCSWGWLGENRISHNLEASIESVIRDDRCTVLFPSGNNHRIWPGTMPSVLSVGGVHADPVTGHRQPSDFSAAYFSHVYPGRSVPDVCGLCGQLPKGVYLVMPCPPNSRMDREYAAKPYPIGDDTAPDDGWMVASGTSAATAQVAGAAALLIEHLNTRGVLQVPADIKSRLMRSALPVLNRCNSLPVPSIPGGVQAAGCGLVSVTAALQLP